MKKQIWMAAIAAGSLVLSGCGGSNGPLSSEEEARLSLLIECNIYATNYELLLQKANSIASRWGMPSVERNPQPDSALVDSTGKLAADFANDLKSQGRFDSNKEEMARILQVVSSRVTSNVNLNGGSSVEDLQKITDAIAWFNSNCYNL